MSVNERTIKVLHCNNDNYNLGGAFIITYRVNELLLKKGIVCDYITMDHFVDSCNFSIPEGVKTFSANLRKNRFLGHIILPFYVYSILKKEKYDILHIDIDSAWKALLYAIPGKICDCKIIVHSHSSGIDGDAKRIKAFIESFSKVLLLGFTSCYLACSSRAAKWIVPTRYQKKVKIIFNGIDFNKFYFSHEERRLIRNNYKWENKFVIGNVALVTENKNQEFLIELIDSLRRIKDNSILVLIGNNKTEYADYLRRLIKQKKLEDHVVFLGEIGNVRELMNAMDVYIQSSHFEGLPLVCVESQACGLDTFISKTISNEVCISEWCDSFSLDIDIDDFAARIASITSKEEIRQSRKLDKKYSLTYMAKKEVDIYNQLI